MPDLELKVRINKYDPQKYGICADITLYINDCFAVHNIKVVSGFKGLFVAMPSTKVFKGDGGKKVYVDTAHPTNADFKKLLDSVILNAYYEYKL